MKNFLKLGILLSLSPNLLHANSDPLYRTAAQHLSQIGANITDPSVQRPAQNRCAGSCHFHGDAVSENSIKGWSNATTMLFKCLNATSDAKEQEKCLQNPSNPTEYAPRALGIARGMVGSEYFQSLFRKAYPDDQEFKLKYLKFVTTTQMPPFNFGPDNPNEDLNLVKFEAPYFGQDQYVNSEFKLPFSKDASANMLRWILGQQEFANKPLLYLSDLMAAPVNPTDMPTQCVEKVSDELKQHVRHMDSFGWARKHLVERKTLMFGCNTAPDIELAMEDDQFDYNTWAKDCLKDFPSTAQVSYAQTWPSVALSNGQPVNQTMRLIRELPYKTHYWTRSSADGRFIGNGLMDAKKTDLGPKAQGYILDLANKDSHGKDRIVGISGPYDPGFFPDNMGFTWHTSTKAAMCNLSAISLSELPGDKPFFDLDNHPNCNAKEMATYQHPAASLSNNTGNNKYWIVLGSYSNDNTGTPRNSNVDPLTFQATDPDPVDFTKSSAYIELYNVYDKVNNPNGFEIDNALPISTPYEGDFGTSQSGKYLTSRFAKKSGSNYIQLGYRLSSVDYPRLQPPTDNSNEAKAAAKIANRDKRKQFAEICLKGSKVSTSFNERFIVTHHIVDGSEEDRIELGYAAEGQPAPADHPERTYENYKKLAHRSSNIWIFDLMTGKKQRLTHMSQHQFATYPHFRADGWIYFLVRDKFQKQDYLMATDAAIQMQIVDKTENL